MIRVLVADDHPMVREGLRALIEQLPDLELVGEASTGLEAVKEAVAERPDVVIMDLAMPELDGFEATRQIARVAPDMAVLVLTMTEDDRTLSSCDAGRSQGLPPQGSDEGADRPGGDRRRCGGGRSSPRPLPVRCWPSHHPRPACESVPSAQPTRAPGSRPAGGGPLERGDRRRAPPVLEDHQQRDVHDLHQLRSPAAPKRSFWPATKGLATDAGADVKMLCTSDDGLARRRR